MSKRNSTAPSNTLFNYFTKTPPSNKKPKLPDDDDSQIVPKQPVKPDEEKAQKRDRELSISPTANEECSDDDLSIGKRRKRIRLLSDDSETENRENGNTTPKERLTLSKKLSNSFKFESSEKPKDKQRNTHSTPTRKSSLPSQEPVASVTDDGNWIHCRLEWLKPDKIRDAKKRKPDHPDYDPRTLFVPDDFKSQQTPAHRQWWEMKSSHFDCVLFFKVGKFYELYHMDAAVGVNELGFSYMKGEFAHSGFPESAYSRMASTLISKGYKVARVEQTETPDMMQERCKRTGQNTKWDKVVQREICQVTVRGTQICGLQDLGPSDPGANLMIAIAEEENNGCSTYGVCFIDTSIGQFHLGQFADDKHSSRLLTTLAHFPPALVISERKTTSPRTSKLLSTHCHNARRETYSTFWTPDKTLKILAEKYYKTDSEGSWPEGLKPFLNQADALGLTPAENCYLTIKALGGCLAYLTDSLLDIQVLGMAQFETYAPPDVHISLSQDSVKEHGWTGGNNMVLDAITLKNLRIVGEEGGLYDRLNFCCTAMGKRLLHQWVCAPSCKLSTIQERQDAVKTLLQDQELFQDTKNILSSLPDLERLLAKVHALGNLRRSKQHPDARAIFYEEKIYSKRKVLDFLSLLKGFDLATKVVDIFSGVESKLLRRLTQHSPGGVFPDFRDSLRFFKESFNHAEAEKDGIILPGKGVDQEYDAILVRIKDIEEELKDYLKEQESIFKCRLSYVGSDKKRYQIEVPQSACSRASSDYHMESARKGFKRFSTAETKDFLSRMMAAEDQKRSVLKDLSRRIFERFSQQYETWAGASRCLAQVDVLCSLAEYARQQNCDVCLPEVYYDGGKPYMSIVEGRHPCIPIVEEFIPNGAELGGGGPGLLLLTGPNMGGKSTLMRQMGLLTVLAHLGSYVPAQQCKLSLVDRVFTRLGASDDILSGQSTFLVEMNETAAIVRHATLHSLVLLDELGRGTSTYDGTALASGVCVALCERGCRVVFSTHYHALVQHLAARADLLLGHMACMVETDEATPDNSDEIPEETITFLYKLTPGACPKSYGFNAARLAGIPKDITRRGHEISKKLEKEATSVRAFRDIVKCTDPKELRKILSNLRI